MTRIVRCEQATTSTTLDELLAREEAAAHATEQFAEAQRQEQAARDQLGAATAAVADAERDRNNGALELQSQELKDADAEMLLLHAVELHIAIATLRTDVRALEEAAERARTLRASAQARRTQASDIDQSAASRVLPTREQIAAWQELDHELKTDSNPSSAPQPTPLMPTVLAVVLTFAIVATSLRLGAGWSLSAALAAGIVAAAMAGGVAWAGLQSRVRSQSADHERRTRRRDRWTQEVEPRLRAAGLTKLADYEGAVADLERQKVEAQRLRNQADRDDLDAGEAERRAAPLESRRDEVARLEREQPIADAVAVAERVQALGGDVDRVRLQIGEVRTNREAARARLRADADAVVTRAIAQHRARQAEYDAAARNLTAAETTLSLARQQCNPDEVARLRARLAEFVDVPTCTVSEASTALDAAKVREATAVTMANGLKARFDEMQPRVTSCCCRLGR